MGTAPARPGRPRLVCYVLQRRAVSPSDRRLFEGLRQKTHWTLYETQRSQVTREHCMWELCKVFLSKHVPATSAETAPRGPAASSGKRWFELHVPTDVEACQRLPQAPGGALAHVGVTKGHVAEIPGLLLSVHRLCWDERRELRLSFSFTVSDIVAVNTHPESSTRVRSGVAPWGLLFPGEKNVLRGHAVGRSHGRPIYWHQHVISAFCLEMGPLVTHSGGLSVGAPRGGSLSPMPPPPGLGLALSLYPLPPLHPPSHLGSLPPPPPLLPLTGHDLKLYFGEPQFPVCATQKG